jgi:putative ABC transport system permease protein
MGTNVFNGPVTCAPMAEALVRDNPEVEAAVRLFPNGNRCIRYGDKTFYEDKFLYADTNFFNIFDFQFKRGNAIDALKKPNGVVLTESTAKKYYGDADPVGKTFKILNSDSTLYEVTAIIADMPANSHFHYDFIASTKSLSYANSTFWVSNNNYTYILLKPGADAKKLEKKFPEMVKHYIGPQIKQFLGITVDDFFKAGNSWGFYLQKLTKIHLYSGMDYELEPNGSITYVYIFMIVALFIMIIACINFTNLATARSINRAKEVGLRKVLGSARKHLIFQFLIESILLSFVAVLLAVLLIESLVPAFNSMLGLKLNFNLFGKFYIIPGILIFTLIVGFIAGSYPAFYLSGFIPAEVLKGKLTKGSKRSWLRNSLVVFQFWISIIIILGTFTVYNQLNYLQNKKLGYDKEKVVVIERTDPIKKDIKLFIDEIKKNPIIIEASLSSGVPGRIYSNNGMGLEGSPANTTYLLSVFSTDCNYKNTMGLEMASGRYFSEAFPTDSNAIVINETAAKYIGLKDLVGRRMVAPAPDPKQRQFLTIIGIVKDFHYENLHKPINPMLIGFSRQNYDGYITVRLAAGENKETLKFLNQTWKKYSTSAPLTYFYFNQEFDKLYKAEYQTRQIMSFFAILAIFIACLGLFGLVAFTTAKRTKEIGIRKVMGASIFTIIGLLSKDTIKLVLIAAFFAIPFAYYFMNSWLQNFAYRIKISPVVFLIAGSLAICISILTIIYQALKAARRNPIEALRYE